MDAQVADSVKAFDAFCPSSCRRPQKADVTNSEPTANGTKSKLAESLADFTDEELQAELQRRASS